MRGLLNFTSINQSVNQFICQQHIQQYAWFHIISKFSTSFGERIYRN